MSVKHSCPAQLHAPAYTDRGQYITGTSGDARQYDKKAEGGKGNRQRVGYHLGTSQGRTVVGERLCRSAHWPSGLLLATIAARQHRIETAVLTLCEVERIPLAELGEDNGWTEALRRVELRLRTDPTLSGVAEDGDSG